MNRIAKTWMEWVLAAVCMAGALPAWALPPAKGPVILTISGKVGAKNTADAAEFDLAMLQSLPQRSFTTLTPWDKKTIRFTGPLLRDVLAAAQASGQTLKALALNDYQARIPLDDAQRFDVIVAHQMDGQPIPVRTKGPLFIVYPYDTQAQLRATTYYERSVWQLKALVIE